MDAFLGLTCFSFPARVICSIWVACLELLRGSVLFPGCTVPSLQCSCAHSIYTVLTTLDFVCSLIPVSLSFCSSFSLPQTQLGLSSALGRAHGGAYPTVLELLVILPVLISSAEKATTLPAGFPSPLSSLQTLSPLCPSLLHFAHPTPSLLGPADFYWFYFHEFVNFLEGRDYV